MLTLSFLFLVFSAPASLSAPNYIAERDPPMPGAKEQYRVWLRTPDRECSSWRKVKPILHSGDFLLSESKRDERAKPPGCKFLWVVTPAAAAGDMRFELEGTTGPLERFVVPVGGRSSPSLTGGVANENGTGPASGGFSGKLKLGGAVNGDTAPPPGDK